MFLLDIIQLRLIKPHHFLVNKSLALKPYVVLGIIVMATAGLGLVHRALMELRKVSQPHHVPDYALQDITVQPAHRVRDRCHAVVVAFTVP